jgi:hypothetical protein
LHAELLICPKGEGDHTQPARIRKETKNQTPKQPVGDRTVESSLDLRARCREELVVLDARGTCRDARHTSETSVKVPSDAIREFGFIFESALEHGDATPR